MPRWRRVPVVRWAPVQPTHVKSARWPSPAAATAEERERHAPVELLLFLDPDLHPVLNVSLR